MAASGDIVALGSGHYRLVEQLGGSAYGLLWRARRGGLGDVALKLVNREQMANAAPALRRRWSECAQREIAFLAGLSPWDARHIVRLLDHGSHEGLPAMALELLDGDLGAHMAALGAAGERVTLARALAWLSQINGALAKVHAHGWRYLDLKPGNLLLDRASASLKLADFGTNRSLFDTAAHSYTGTANWQAPEQFFPHDAGYLTDARTDYFALGAVFYYLVTNGDTLRYCGSCAAAWREHGLAGAARLRERWDGALPAILAEDEAARFAACAGQNGADPAPSLALLRCLLAARREDRPRHALAISRLIAAASGAAQPWRSAA